jgi:hypothetical protein
MVETYFDRLRALGAFYNVLSLPHHLLNCSVDSTCPTTDASVLQRGCQRHESMTVVDRLDLQHPKNVWKWFEVGMARHSGLRCSNDSPCGLRRYSCLSVRSQIRAFNTSRTLLSISTNLFLRSVVVEDPPRDFKLTAYGTITGSGASGRIQGNVARSLYRARYSAARSGWTFGLVHLRQRHWSLIRCIGKRVGNGIQEQGGMYRFGNNFKHMPHLRCCVQ